MGAAGAGLSTIGSTVAISSFLPRSMHIKLQFHKNVSRFVMIEYLLRSFEEIKGLFSETESIFCCSLSQKFLNWKASMLCEQTKTQ
jgi:hypothetical protein